MATLEDLDAELQRRNGSQPAAAPSAPAAPAAQTGLTINDLDAELARRASAPQTQPQQPQSRDWFQTADDAVRRFANAATFGLADKLAAKGNEALGYGNYDTNLKGERAQSEQAGQRLGTAGRLAADFAGGASTAAIAPAFGLTLAGRVPQAASLATKMAAGAAEGAAYGGLQGAGNTDTGNVSDYFKNAGREAALGGVVGAALPAAVTAARRVITPNPTNLSAEQQRLLSVLDQAGVDTSAAQRTGSKPLAFMEDQVSKLPLGNALAKNPNADSRNQFVKAALDKAGITADAATPDVIDQGFRDIGSRIGNITSNHQVQFDPQYSRDIYGVIGEYGRNLKPDQKDVIKGYITDLAKSSRLDGDQYQTIRSQMGRRIRAENGPGGDKEFQNALIGMQNALDDAAERSMLRAGAVKDVSLLRDARQQYANLDVISKAVARSGQSGAVGELTPSALEGALKSSVGARNYSRGVGDLNDLARAGSAFLRTPPDSGTSSRDFLSKLAMVAGGGYGVAGPVGAGAAVGSLPIAGYLVNGRLPQRYLGNQLLAAPINAGATTPATAGLLGDLTDAQRKRNAISIQFLGNGQ